MLIIKEQFSNFGAYLLHPQNKPHILRLSHMLTWCAVIAFLTDAFINIIIFGVLRGDYETWCLNKSRNYVDEQVTAILGNGTQITFSFNPSQSGVDLYNCEKMWQDELKLGIVVWIVLTIVYVSKKKAHFYFLTIK
jgi:hypothetical protein